MAFLFNSKGLKMAVIHINRLADYIEIGGLTFQNQSRKTKVEGTVEFNEAEVTITEVEGGSNKIVGIFLSNSKFIATNTVPLFETYKGKGEIGIYPLHTIVIERDEYYILTIDGWLFLGTQEQILEDRFGYNRYVAQTLGWIKWSDYEIPLEGTIR